MLHFKRVVRFKFLKIGKYMRVIFTTLVIIGFLHAQSATAEFSIVSQRDEFLKIINGKQLERPLIKLQVSDIGQISGRALMIGVRGTWSWQKGYFCRDLFWGKRALGYNCQQVSLRGDKIRFTSDEGKGDYADFTLK